MVSEDGVTLQDLLTYLKNKKNTKQNFKEEKTKINNILVICIFNI